MFRFLNKPFPRSHLDKKSLTSSFIVGIFVACFLIVFQPFGISEWLTENKFFKLLGFGLVSFIIPLIIGFVIALIIQKKPVEDNWTIGKEIIVILIILVCIAVGNMFYGRLLYIMPFTWNGFLFAFISVVLIGIFPVTLHVLRKHNKLLKINLEKATVVNEHLHPEEIKKKVDEHIPKEEPAPNMPDNIADEIKIIPKLIFIAENEKDKLEVFPEQLLYIEAADNYSNIVFMEDEKIKKHLIRSSLKRIESQINFDLIVRCHRTFIVNLRNVKNVEGNAAGYKLYFNKDNYFVPVSRNYGNSILEKLKNLK
ncbi:MAG: LytTR family DNA-binding domain-containing protein [Bacteroidota bacterium]|nr:LytTR family DNA-binding domain-containing protein [Bacteroidota bacterium]